MPLKFLLDYNVTRQNVQRSLHSSMFLLEYQKSARIRLEHVCAREECTQTHKHAHTNKDRRLPFIRTKITRVLISSRSIHLPPLRQSHFPPLSTFTVRSRGNPWQRQWKRKSWDEHPTLTCSQWKRGNIAIRRFPSIALIKIYKSSSPREKVSRRKICCRS